MLARLFPFGLTASPDASWRVEKVSTSSRVRASASCSARIGGANIRRLEVTVHRDGFILALRFRAPRAVRASEIRTYDRDGTGATMGLVIIHEAPDVPSPLVLWLGEGSRVEKALRGLEGEYGVVERPGEP